MNYEKVNDEWKCRLCQRFFKSRQAVTSHIYRTHTKPGISCGGHKKGTPAWNKGIKTNQIPWNKGLIGLYRFSHTEEAKRKISESVSLNNRGGRSKWYEVAGQKVQGTWERNIALKFEEMKISWVKLKTRKDIFRYTLNNKERCYTPDFYLPDFDLYLEIKGYWWGNDKEKMKVIFETYKDKKIIIIEKKEYEKILGGELVW